MKTFKYNALDDGCGFGPDGDGLRGRHDDGFVGARGQRGHRRDERAADGWLGRAADGWLGRETDGRQRQAGGRPGHRRDRRGRGRLRKLADALTKAGLVDALKGKGPFTVFAPTDAAFEAFENANPGRWRA